MARKSRSSIIFITIFALLEAIFVALFALAYYLNWRNFKDFLTVRASLLAAVIIVLLNLIISFIIINFETNKRYKNQFSSMDVLGEDINEAYEFGQLGLIVTNDEGEVIWLNELMLSRGFDIIGENIFTWCGQLRNLSISENKNVLKIFLNNRNYEVKYLPNANLFIFKDVTNEEEVSSTFEKQKTVTGLVMIDNYDQLTSYSDGSIETITKVRVAITEYFKSHNVLLKSVDENSFFAVCSASAIKVLIADKFSILDTVRAIKTEDGINATLSIGFAYNFPSILKLNELTNDAIEIAMARGGDQAVVSEYGEDIQYFGGLSTALETRNKVKDRVMGDSLVSLIKNSKRVFIMGHTNLDMDALGACLCAHTICEQLKVNSSIVYDPKLVELKAKNAILDTLTKNELERITVRPNEAYSEMKEDSLLIVVDVSKPKLTMEPRLLEKTNNVVLIDHHRRSEDFLENLIFSYIESSASSTCELLAGIVNYANVTPKLDIPSDFATIMLSGIFLDSNYFKSSVTGSRAFEASMILKNFGADNKKADDFLKDEYEEYSLITKIISTMKTPYYGVVFCTANDDIVEQSVLAKVANTCLSLRGVKASFVMGRTNQKDVSVSCRSDGSVNVQILAEKMGGGGHFASAACYFKDKKINEAEEEFFQILSRYLDDARASTKED